MGESIRIVTVTVQSNDNQSSPPPELDGGVTISSGWYRGYQCDIIHCLVAILITFMYLRFTDSVYQTVAVARLVIADYILY